MIVPSLTAVRRLLTPALALLLAALAGCATAPGKNDAGACPSEPPVATQAFLEQGLRNARDRGYLWRIEQGGRVSWLYGTLHVAAPAWAFPGPTVLSALKASDVLAVELDMLDAKSLRPALEDGAAPELDDARRARRDAVAQNLCLPSPRLAALPLALQASTLTLQGARRDGLYAEFGIDAALSGAARAMGKRVRALERAGDQMRVLSGDSQAETLRRFDETLGALESGTARATIARLAYAWADSDLGTLASYADWCDCAGTPAERALLHTLLGARNGPMADRIAALHASGRKVFVAVGSLHMIGADGLPALLAARGFTVTQVLPPPSPAAGEML